MEKKIFRGRHNFYNFIELLAKLTGVFLLSAVFLFFAIRTLINKKGDIALFLFIGLIVLIFIGISFLKKVKEAKKLSSFTLIDSGIFYNNQYTGFNEINNMNIRYLHQITHKYRGQRGLSMKGPMRIYNKIFCCYTFCSKDKKDVQIGYLDQKWEGEDEGIVHGYKNNKKVYYEKYNDTVAWLLVLTKDKIEAIIEQCTAAGIKVKKLKYTKEELLNM